MSGEKYRKYKKTMIATTDTKTLQNLLQQDTHPLERRVIKRLIWKVTTKEKKTTMKMKIARMMKKKMITT
jgi:hypothetical protein